jgi:hypothetical protein
LCKCIRLKATSSGAAVGKHKGRSFPYVVGSDPGYLEWARALPEATGEVLNFVQWARVNAHVKTVLMLIVK